MQSICCSSLITCFPQSVSHLEGSDVFQCFFMEPPAQSDQYVLRTKATAQSPRIGECQIGHRVQLSGAVLVSHARGPGFYPQHHAHRSAPDPPGPTETASQCGPKQRAGLELEGHFVKNGSSAKLMWEGVRFQGYGPIGQNLVE